MAVVAEDVLGSQPSSNCENNEEKWKEANIVGLDAHSIGANTFVGGAE